MQEGFCDFVKYTNTSLLTTHSFVVNIHQNVQFKFLFLKEFLGSKTLDHQENHPLSACITPPSHGPDFCDTGPTF